MDASGEVADLMVKESIQLTEESIKLLAAGCKNLTAFLYALAKDNKKLVGKTSMKRLLREGKELKTFCIKAEDLNDFRKYAKIFLVNLHRPPLRPLSSRRGLP